MEALEALKPAGGQVVMLTHAIGVNSLDVFLRTGHNPNHYIDAAGVIVAIGSGVTNVKVGDRVYGESCWVYRNWDG